MSMDFCFANLMSFLRLTVSLLLLVVPLYLSSNAAGQSVHAGGAYVGCGYDVLFGNPDGASFMNGGADPGIKTTKFILQKTFTDRDFCPMEATCVGIGGTFSEEAFSLQADMKQYKEDYTASWSSDNQANLLLASYGGVLSYSSKEAKEIIEGQEKIILTKRRVTLSADASYRYRENKQLNQEFLHALCELPTDYSINEYSSFLMEWGTHVILAAKLGIRESVREEHSKQTIINYLQRNQSGVLSSKGNILSVLSTSLTGSISNAVINDLRNDNIASRRWTSATGSPVNPAPLALTLRGMEKFITPEHINNSTLCPAVQGKINVDQLRKRISQALDDYAALNGAKTPEAMVRSVPLVWPKGIYGLLMASTGCPSGPWSTGNRFHDTQDTRPNNGWSDGFDGRTASDLWNNNLRLKFCIKQIEFDDSALDLPQGSYCLFKKGSCPFGFSIADTYIDDEDFYNKNDYNGTLPDGQYDRNTRYYFCCRNDGAVRKPIYLPTDMPFLLMPMGPACQAVANMDSELHWLRIDGMGKGYNKVSEKGPYYTQDRKNNLTFYFCYYAPIKKGNNTSNAEVR